MGYATRGAFAASIFTVFFFSAPAHAGLIAASTADVSIAGANSVATSGTNPSLSLVFRPPVLPGPALPILMAAPQEKAARSRRAAFSFIVGHGMA